MAERHISNFSNSSTGIILDLINHYNGTAFTSEKVDLVNLVPVPESKAVQLTVQSKRGGGYRGSKNVNYNRLFLNEIPDPVTDFEFEVDIVKLSDVIAFINTGYDVNIGADEVTISDTDTLVTDASVVQEFDVVQQFTIKAKPGSLVWMGDLTFSLTKIRSDLGDIWQVVTPDGLYPPINWPEEPVFKDESGFMRQRPDGSFRVMG